MPKKEKLSDKPTDEAIKKLFPKKVVEKNLNKILSQQEDLSVEEIVKAALKMM